MEFAPQKAISFLCFNNDLKNLIGCPESLECDLDCSENSLSFSYFAGFPKTVKNLTFFNTSICEDDLSCFNIDVNGKIYSDLNFEITEDAIYIPFDNKEEFHKNFDRIPIIDFEKCYTNALFYKKLENIRERYGLSQGVNIKTVTPLNL